MLPAFEPKGVSPASDSNGSNCNQRIFVHDARVRTRQIREEKGEAKDEAEAHMFIPARFRGDVQRTNYDRHNTPKSPGSSILQSGRNADRDPLAHD
jgi:hypothetical protein